MNQPDYRIYELNKRLQHRAEESDNLWWDAFATEFFEDDAILTLAFCLEDGPKRYSKIVFFSFCVTVHGAGFPATLESKENMKKMSFSL
ncbi:LIM domain-binding protein 2 [Holothuria leucospilota]|uniref:LIM domain-binding protein 2 n=1 Tax=Holothuria leucospilota TaxID=206669 RepID=A0A9Q0YSM3_HOLLE|nr:LIM domain-binding protein 2 [Holothuria leucospilota]